MFKKSIKFLNADLLEKSSRIFETLKVPPGELQLNRVVVLYTRNRICSKCSREVKRLQAEYVENICSDHWRYYHGFAYRSTCPLSGIMKFTKYSKLRTEEKTSLYKLDSDKEN